MRRLVWGMALAWLAAGGARAGTIVQSTPFKLAEHGSDWHGIAQLPPSLAPLNAVVIESSASTGEAAYRVQNASDRAASATVTADFVLSTDAGSVDLEHSFSVTLAPNQIVTLTWDVNGGSPFTARRVVTTDPGQYVGTGSLSPYFYAFAAAYADNPAIVFLPEYTTAVSDLPSVTGSETFTYYYGTSFPVPEPASVVSMGVGILGLAGLARARRRRYPRRDDDRTR